MHNTQRRVAGSVSYAFDRSPDTHENLMAAVNTKGEMGAVARHLARVAAKLFADRGYEATSVREIVEAAGVAKPTLYYHFQSKEGLASAVLTVPLSNLVESLRRIVTTVEDPVLCLEQVIEARYITFREDPDRGRFIYALLFGPSRTPTSPASSNRSATAC